MNLNDADKILFQFFNEVGIIQQLSYALFNKRLPDGLHVAHFSVLNHLVRLGSGKTPLELAKAFQVSKGTMTHTLGELAKRKLIALVPHETDGRSKLVHITEKGEMFHKTAIAGLGPSFAILGVRLESLQIAAMLPELRKIRAVLDASRDI